MLKKDPIRKVYLYLFTIIGLVLVVIGTVGIVNLFLKTVIFTEADIDYYYDTDPIRPDSNTSEVAEERSKQVDYNKAQNQRDAARNIALLIVGVPLYLYHWTRIKKEQ